MTNGEKFKEVFGFGADGSRVIAVNTTWWDCEFQNRKPITNADRIKNMTDKELAEFLCLPQRMCPVDNCEECLEDNCQKCILNWLRKGVESEGMDERTS